MIIAITMNPSVDILYQLDTLQIGTTNRTSHVSKTAGGKGINVARVAHLLGEKVVATGLLGGTTGDFIKEQLAREGISHQFLQTEQASRNCIAMLHEGYQTEILEAGPTFSEVEEKQFLAHLQQLLEQATIVTISGSLPKGLPANMYQTMIAMAHKQCVPVLLDASGAPLRQSLLGKEKPFLIKPNQEELRDLLRKPVGTSPAELQAALSAPLFKDVHLIIISLGGDGAFAKVGDTYYTVKIPTIDVVNPVGSGDATVAGLAVAISKEQSAEDMLKTAMTAGMLNAMERKTGHLNKEKFADYFQQVTVGKYDRGVSKQ